MTRYAVQCAGGGTHLLPSPLEEGDAWLWVDLLRAGEEPCGPHTVVELPEPCPCGKKPNGCDCPTYEQFVNGPNQ